MIRPGQVGAPWSPSAAREALRAFVASYLENPLPVVGQSPWPPDALTNVTRIGSPVMVDDPCRSREEFKVWCSDTLNANVVETQLREVAGVFMVKVVPR